VSNHDGAGKSDLKPPSASREANSADGKPQAESNVVKANIQFENLLDSANAILETENWEYFKLLKPRQESRPLHDLSKLFPDDKGTNLGIAVVIFPRYGLPVEDKSVSPEAIEQAVRSILTKTGFTNVMLFVRADGIVPVPIKQLVPDSEKVGPIH
jgi:hypothetical protein